jgi:hypothetical protein
MDQVLQLLANQSPTIQCAIAILAKTYQGDQLQRRVQAAQLLISAAGADSENVTQWIKDKMPMLQAWQEDKRVNPFNQGLMNQNLQSPNQSPNHSQSPNEASPSLSASQSPSPPAARPQTILSHVLNPQLQRLALRACIYLDVDRVMATRSSGERRDLYNQAKARANKALRALRTARQTLERVPLTEGALAEIGLLEFHTEEELKLLAVVPIE